MIIEPARLPWKANRDMGSLMIHIPLRDVNVASKQKMRSFCVQFITVIMQISSAVFYLTSFKHEIFIAEGTLQDIRYVLKQF